MCDDGFKKSVDGKDDVQYNDHEDDGDHVDDVIEDDDDDDDDVDDDDYYDNDDGLITGGSRKNRVISRLLIPFRTKTPQP